MAVDKLVDSAQLDADLTSVANAIRTKGGTSGSLAFPAGFVSAIGAIPTGGGAIDWDGFVNGTWPTGAVVLSNDVTSIPSYKFYGFAGITSVSGSGVQQLGKQAFNNCNSLVSVDFPNVTTLESAVFYQVPVSVLNFPNVQTLTTDSFQGVARNTGHKTIIVLPNLAGTVAQGAFRYAEAIIDLGAGVTSLGSLNIHQGSTNLVILRSPNVVTASAASSITTVTDVYVPQSLISAYEQATNWSAKGSIFHAIEGSQYEHYYADGTPIT